MNTKILIFPIILVVIIALALGVSATISCSETMSRTSSVSSVASGGTFQLSYTALGTSGSWGASVVDSISGGCTISGKTSLNIVMVSDLPNPLTYTVQAPSSGSCTFTGNYQFGSCSINNFNTLTVTIGSGVCTPDNSCQANTCTTATCTNNCGTVLSGTKTCTTCTDSSWNPDTSTICSGTSFTQTSNCGTTRSILGTKENAEDCSSPPPTFDICTSVNKLNINWFKLDDPCMGNFIGIAVIIGAFLIVLKFAGGK